MTLVAQCVKVKFVDIISINANTKKIALLTWTGLKHKHIYIYNIIIINLIIQKYFVLQVKVFNSNLCVQTSASL